MLTPPPPTPLSTPLKGLYSLCIGDTLMRLAIWHHHHKFWEISKAETCLLLSVEFFHLKLPVKKTRKI